MVTKLIPRGFVASVLMCMIAGCKRADESSPAEKSAATSISNRIDIPIAVRRNLGITFAQVESRQVTRTLRVPGRFELAQGARQEYRAMMPGIVRPFVTQFAKVERGTPLYRIDAPKWRELQREIAEADAALREAAADHASLGPLFDAHERHHAQIEESVKVHASRVELLESLRAAGGARGDEESLAKVALSQVRAELAETMEKEAELLARRARVEAELDSARVRRGFLLNIASTLSGLDVIALQAPALEHGGVASWAVLNEIEVKAAEAGIVESIFVSSGGFADEHACVIAVVQPESIRFRAALLQSDALKINDGQTASVVPAQAGAAGAINGNITIATTADPDRRTIDLIFTPNADDAKALWARPGTTASLELMIAGVDRKELAIPMRSVVRDGVRPIVFRRDPANPDKVIRLEADLGLDDGRWVTIRSGVAEGNEIVVDGAYQLMVASSGSIPKGGHFHADGTYHEGDE